MTGDPIFGSPVFMRTRSALDVLQPLFYLALWNKYIKVTLIWRVLNNTIFFKFTLCKLFGDNSRFATRIRLAALFVFAKSSFRAFFLLNRESAKTLSRLVLSKSSFRRIYGANREFSLMAAKSLYSISRNSIFSKAYRDARSSTTEQHPATYEKNLDFTWKFGDSKILQKASRTAQLDFLVFAEKIRETKI